MSESARVIWTKHDGAMPEKAGRIVGEAQGELLLKTLRLPKEVENTIRYNADKGAESINEYVSRIVVERLAS
ncbi:hypothetical protein AGMMS50229_20230 [Campylobacterota bacterium]|nr:hypothetical protein AGMMS50229_20230 [Campylobacterota bacterium]